MILYDGSSDINWFFQGLKTADEMMEDEWFAKLFEQPCVLFDDGAGKVYDYAPLDDVAEMYGVPGYLSDDARAEEVLAKFGGTYKAPGVAEVEEKADAAQTAAQTASEMAATAQAAADEAKGSVADATSAAQIATEAAATAQTTADEAKTTADTAAASVNEYMDALLGLNTTDETEATDAE